jgi:hypothetical protein
LPALGRAVDSWQRLIPRLEISGAIPPLPCVIRTNKPSARPQEDLYMQFYGIFFMHLYKQSGRCRYVLDTISNRNWHRPDCFCWCMKIYHKTACINLPEDEHLSCSKCVEGNIIGLNHLCKKCTFYWFLLHVCITLRGSKHTKPPLPLCCCDIHCNGCTSRGTKVKAQYFIKHRGMETAVLFLALLNWPCTCHCAPSDITAVHIGLGYWGGHSQTGHCG